MTRGKDTDALGFRDIKSEILRRIRSRRWGPGAALPSEIAIAREFSVARGTANRALKELTEEGYLDRRRKAGTVVRTSPVRSARFRIPIVREEIEASGREYGYSLLLRKAAPASAALRMKMELKSGERLLHLRCLHLADGKPFQVEQRWINLTALPGAVQESFRLSGPNEWLVKTVPFSEVEISFLAVPAPASVAVHLKVPDGVPIFSTERSTWWRGQAITHVKLYYLPGYRLTTRY